MTRGGNKNRPDAPERRCIVTGEVQPKAGLIRFVIGPDGEVVPDILEKLPGRGMWVTADRAILDKAKAGQFSRSAKERVKVPDDLIEQVERQLASRVVNLISLARKAGLAVCGFEKVKAWLSTEPVRVLLQAADGSERGKSKLWTPTGARYFGCLTSQELGLAFGRQSVIHGALASGGLSNRVVDEAAKLRGLRDFDGGDGSSGKDTEVS
ncbi:RNA-binding protein [Ponticoccus sp. SC2-23]|uniref:RNA-binding protein n=1 Tax=Alexandriicola marinus TaxID=2081710 RepID=UPI000FD7B908|nr:RNA-binding protein [Alexandriicola marinus]MBM1220684.1 RNA-binding protein [Ponticoccus sp. SC6-9]MBM1225943.1 RNA-binding protein [Ponticoccus sp. SC6-15]MBM1231240.1 RNA-binding protein [Ponticoccus sp. SC6-38]MBM1235899.1 RNA-binding protein [Ponticoccus sp. SC6-45]MBM1240263.1 RNA-binding protein [Ponticoccus sp. SC6-49]MBM1244798.1 RNA-binding protein [Ponticoccus sp. SC2-64]MBM1249373.1 RNA-binding protein [Ponticoccus sp. SC6-42]MBM1252339.1 RNA-binding protein [Ponticoccus sp. 